jgi:hypothetical protein
MAYVRLATLMGMDSELERADLNDPLNPSKDVTPCEDMLKLFGVDTRAVHPDAPIDSQAMVRDQIDDYSYRNEWGVLWVRPKNEDGPYMYKEGPFQKAGITVADVEAYPWPNADAEHRVSGLAERTKKLHEETDYANVLSVGHSSLAPAQRLRGFAELLEDLVLEPELAAAILGERDSGYRRFYQRDSEGGGSIRGRGVVLR